MKVYILDNGYLECDSNWIISMNTYATLQRPDCPPQWLRIPVYAVLVEHPEGRFIFDLGCSPEAANGYWPEYLFNAFPYTFNEKQTLEKQLGLIGLKPADIPTVVLSHMHMDHAGNLDLFPHAKVIVHRQEFEDAQATVKKPDSKTHGAYCKRDLEAQVKEYQLFDDDFELLPGVEIITLPGHSAGTCGMLLKMENGPDLLFPADALYSRINYGPPEHLPGIVYDIAACWESVEKIRKLEASRNAKIMFSHDMEAFKVMLKAPEYYS